MGPGRRFLVRHVVVGERFVAAGEASHVQLVCDIVNARFEGLRPGATLKASASGARRGASGLCRRERPSAHVYDGKGGALAQGEAAAALPAPRAAPNDPVFHRAPTLKIVCWNTLKLRLDAPRCASSGRRRLRCWQSTMSLCCKKCPEAARCFARGWNWSCSHGCTRRRQGSVAARALAPVAAATGSACAHCAQAAARCGSDNDCNARKPALEHAPLVCTIEVPQFAAPCDF